MDKIFLKVALFPFNPVYWAIKLIFEFVSVSIANSGGLAL